MITNNQYNKIIEGEQVKEIEPLKKTVVELKEIVENLKSNTNLIQCQRIWNIQG